MTNYWDSSALVAVCLDKQVADRFWAGEGSSRTHTFAEVFSTLTGGRLGFRVDADEAAELIKELAEHLHIKDLTSTKALAALAKAKSRGVRGGRVHDYLHAATAVTQGCERLITYNVRDFEGLYGELEVITPEMLYRREF